MLIWQGWETSKDEKFLVVAVITLLTSVSGFLQTTVLQWEQTEWGRYWFIKKGPDRQNLLKKNFSYQWVAWENSH